jgi:hypothetical protein
MRTMLMLAGLALAASVSAESDWYGVTPEVEPTAVPVAALMPELEAHLDQPLAVSGRITDVCTNRGCWAVFEDNGEILRIMARDHGFALPAEYRGPAVAHGVLTRVEISPEHARHLVEDDGADPAVLEQEYEYRLLTDGVRLLGET